MRWPTSIPGRIVLLFWWLVVMVVLAMYTANLAAFLTSMRFSLYLILFRQYHVFSTSHTSLILSISIFARPIIPTPGTIQHSLILLIRKTPSLSNNFNSRSVTKMTTGLTKIEDLLTQDRYRWGTVKDTHPEVALANSVREDFKDIIRKQVNCYSGPGGAFPSYSELY